MKIQHDWLDRHIKKFPEDFIVEEVLDLKLRNSGPFAYYLLKKKNYSSLEIIDKLSSRLKIPRFRFGLSGLKDRRALTTQYISIQEGPPKNLKGHDWSLEFLGYGNEGIQIGQARGNIFTLTVREVKPRALEKALRFIAEEGFANYFGKQRFSPDIHTRIPVAKLLLEDKLDEALKEYLTQHPDPDRSKRLKSVWGLWGRLLKEATHLSHQEKNALRVLKRGESFERAFRVLPKHIKLLFFFSYQSRLWNRILKNLVLQAEYVFSVPFPVEGELVFYRKVCPMVRILRDTEIPFISKEALKIGIPTVVKDALMRVIMEEDLDERLNAEVEGLKVFNFGKRNAIVLPESLEFLEKGKSSLTVRFFLPSGSYATVLMRKALRLRG